MRRIRPGAAAAAAAALCLGAPPASSSAIDVEAPPRPQSHLVVVSNRDGDFDAYSIRADGRRVGALTRNRVADKTALLSPAGGWLVVERPSGLVLVRADGRWERKLGESTHAPEFSSDGRWLAFARETDLFNETRRIELVEAGGDRPARRLGDGSPIRFSADGRRLAYVDGKGNVGVLDVASGRRAQIATARALDGDVPAHGDWSPTLTGFVLERERSLSIFELVYFSGRPGAKARVLARGDFGLSRWLDGERYGYENMGSVHHDFVVARVAGTGRRVIARGVGWGDWSPDGSNLAYTVGERSFVVASTSGPARRTIRIDRGRLYNLNWSPSGRRLGVTTADGNRMDALVVEARTRRVVRRVGGHPGYGAWSPDERLLAHTEQSGVTLLDLQSGRHVVGWAGGDTQIVGWLRGRQPTTLPAAAPAPPTEVLDATGFRSRTPVLELAADGPWVAALLAAGRLDREHVVAWRPPRRAVVRFAPTAPTHDYGTYQQLSLTGTTVRWTSFGCGNSCYLSDVVADVRRPQRFDVGDETVVERKPPRPGPPIEARRGVTATAHAGTIELRHGDGRTRTIRPPGRLVDLELEEAGLFYAYATTGNFRGRVVFVPFDRLL
jgi:WD40-like Beta Propeller Repeat